MGKNRIDQLDMIKGIAMILVIVGHLCSAIVQSGKTDVYSYQMLYNVIYLFHMPLFFFVSGFLSKGNNKLVDKCIRLIIPFIIWGMPHIIGHLVTSFWSENLMKNILQELIFLFLRGGYYWYFIYLFIFYVISNKINKCFRTVYVKWVFLVLICVVYVLGEVILSIEKIIPDVDKFMFNYIFFYLGYLMKEHAEILWKLNVKAMVFAIVISCFGVVIYFGCFSFIKIFVTSACLLSVFELVNLLNTCEPVKDFLSIIGKNTMIIYLFDGYMMIFARKIILMIPKYCILLCIGVLIINIIVPLLCDKYIIRKNHVLRFMCGEC